MLLARVVFITAFIGVLLLLDSALLASAAIFLGGHALVVLLVIGVMLKRTGRSWAGIGFVRPRRSLAHLLWQIPAGMLVALTVQLLFAATLDLEPQDNTTLLNGLPALDPVWIAVLFISIAVLVPLWEEAVCRGVIFEGLARRSTTLGVILSAILFALMHGGVAPMTPFLLVMGVVFALLTRFYRSVWGSVILHAVNNTIVMVGAITLVTTGT